MDVKSILQHQSRLLNYKSAAIEKAPNWDEVFGKAQSDIKKTDTSDGVFSQSSAEGVFPGHSDNIQTNTGFPLPSTPSPSVSSTAEKVSYSPSASSDVTSLNLGIGPRVLDYNRFQAFNDLEKSFQEGKLYAKEKITNPYNVVNTNNYATDGYKNEFSKKYSDWDGVSEDGTKFAYVDKYGYSHVSKNFFSALIYSQDGKVYNYKGTARFGDALDAKGNRMWLSSLENSIPFGNVPLLSDRPSQDTQDIAAKVQTSYSSTSTQDAADNSNTANETIKQENPSVFNSSYTDRFPYTPKTVDVQDKTRYDLYRIPLQYLYPSR